MTLIDTQTGRYRFRRGMLGWPVLQAEFLTSSDELVWRDVKRSQLVPERVFSIVRPSQWLRFIAAQDLPARIATAERRKRAAKKKGTPEFEASKLT